ncbi:MAG: hypothetical protein LIV24_11085, partial [Eubacterium sp.]|nr:hypothetical protein [Eubacterium sp.]
IDGFSTSVNTIIITVCMGLSTGLFNLLLARTGYVAPKLVDGLTVAATQPGAVQTMITFCFVGLEVFTSIVMIFLLSKLDVEKHIDEEQKEIKARREAK